MDSFISVPRAIFDDDAFPEEPFSRREAFLDLVQRATYKQITIPVKGGVATVGRGELIVSIRKLAARWGWSKSKVEKVLDEFVSQQRIGHRTDGATTILSITNYDMFQRSVDTYKDTDQDANQDNINKDNKENKVEKKDAIASKEKSRRFVPPTVDEVRAFCAENGCEVDAEKFVNYYSSIGWVVGKAKTPMKNWKAAIRTWLANDKRYTRGQSSPRKQDGHPATFGSSGRMLKPQDV